MGKILAISLLLYLAAHLLPGCKKRPISDPCNGVPPPGAEFKIKENLRDTSFFADSVYRNNRVSFEATRTYDSTVWKVGDDPRSFHKPSFNLSFVNFLGTIDVFLTARTTPNQRCFPGDDGVYTASKRLTVLEQFDKPGLSISPLVGSYKGAFKETPTDTFTVSINYFDSAKYDVSMTGVKNFYWISNMPKGYRDTTSSPALAYPELRNGMVAEMGYKCFQFGNLGSTGKGLGFAELKQDTLIIYYNHIQTGRKTFFGKRK